MKGTIEIDLTIDINNLREIYYQGDHLKYFFGPETRRQSIYLVLAVLIFPFFAIHALNSTIDAYFVIGCMFFVFLFYDYWKVASPIISKKKSIDKYLEKVKTIKVLKLKYNEDFFIHIQDNQELKRDWNVVERAIIRDDYIWILSNTNILLPRSSMTQNEFEDLSKTVMTKVKNVTKE